MRLVAAVVAALACAGIARAGGLAALPSPVARLSPDPPLGNGATSSAENAPHTVAASTNVAVAIDEAGRPFAVSATQRLDVLGAGDYFFTIGAPVLTVRAAPGSTSIPGMRSQSIIWAGFDPGQRLLSARVTLDTRRVASTLPIRIHTRDDAVVLDNETAVSVDTFIADAPRAPLTAYLEHLRADLANRRPPQQASVPLSSRAVADRVTVVAQFHVVGTVGTTPVEAVLDRRLRIRAHGRVDLRVEPLESVPSTPGGTGRALLRSAIRTSLTLARTRQFEEYLGNPDANGVSQTVFAYRTTKPTHAAPIATVRHGRPRWLAAVLVVCLIAAAVVGAATVWARS
jgi:hypothetical protein